MNSTNSAEYSYMAGILHTLGCVQGDRFSVRCVDRFYPDIVQPMFGTSVYSIQSHGKVQYIVKAPLHRVNVPVLSDIPSPPDFIRAVCEIQGGVNPITQHVRKGIRHVVGFKIYGSENVLSYIMEHAPIAPKRINPVHTNTGDTFSIILQMKDTEALLEYIDGLPHNDSVWKLWEQRTERIRGMD